MSAIPVPTHLTPSWRDATAVFDLTLRRQVDATVVEAAEELAHRFYGVMLADPRTHGLLDHDQVNQRLHASMASWLRMLFDPDLPLDRIIALQQRTGAVHARIGVPMDLVAAGARVIKRDLADRLASGALPRPRLAHAIQYVYELVDMAVDTMNTAYESSASRMVRADEAYRLHFLHQDMKAERERQRSLLLEWAHQILVSGYGLGTLGQEPSGNAEAPAFGLWLQHKASILFEGAPELPEIHACMERLERDWIPRLRACGGDPALARGAVAGIERAIDDIKQRLATMFDRYMAAEDGRDSVTRLLNRRYFATVARREIALATRQGSSFALVEAELDQFDRTRDAIGLEASDALLGDVADALMDSVRAGDFVFRVGEARFLLLLVEMGADALPGVVEGLRRTIEDLRPRSRGKASVAVTASIGAARFDGHPDYQLMLDRSGAALREAQVAGGNRWSLAGS